MATETTTTTTTTAETVKSPTQLEPVKLVTLEGKPPLPSPPHPLPT